jgi:uncharacterized protein
VRFLPLVLITCVACASAPSRPKAPPPGAGLQAARGRTAEETAPKAKAAPPPETEARPPASKADTAKAEDETRVKPVATGQREDPAPAAETAQDEAPGSEGAQTPSPDAARPGPEDRPGPEQPLFLLIGDSMVVAELGRDMGRTLERTFSGDVRRRGKSSSGLARPDFFDWFREGARLADAHRPDVVVVIIGGNDGQDLVDEEGRGRIRWRTERWPAAYASRVHRFLDAMQAEGRRFVWVELPAMDHRNLEGKLQLIRRVQREALEGRSDVLGHVDTQACFYDGKGRLRTVIPSGRKKGRPLRQEDGIHFSLFGARWVSRCLAPQLVELVERRVAVVDDDRS